MRNHRLIGDSETDNSHFENRLRARGWDCVAGTDEAGRGPLAGPVVAACVSFPEDADISAFQDSKMLTAARRRYLAGIVRQGNGCVGIGVVSHQRIDTINILQASLLAMKLSVLHHGTVAGVPDYLLVDGNFTIALGIAQLALKKGESKSGSIAAASIIAKVYRDRIMTILDKKHPQYGFARNKGYPTRAHRQAIASFGPCPCHRMTFKGVREFVA
ncbi:MAG: ribonuclease HII [Desulfopila sp.]